MSEFMLEYICILSICHIIVHCDVMIYGGIVARLFHSHSILVQNIVSKAICFVLSISNALEFVTVLIDGQNNIVWRLGIGRMNGRNTVMWHF